MTPRIRILFEHILFCPWDNPLHHFNLYKSCALYFISWSQWPFSLWYTWYQVKWMLKSWVGILSRAWMSVSIFHHCNFHNLRGLPCTKISCW